MSTVQFQLAVPPRFNFWSTVYSHGWCALPPFCIDKEQGSFSRLLESKDGTLVNCVLGDASNKIAVVAQSGAVLTASQKGEIRQQLSGCFRLEEEISDFYRQAQRYPGFRWVLKVGAGRMLRAPTVFEDVVKMICTTNCSWGLTEVMVENLTIRLGRSFKDDRFSFPTPDSIAGTTDAFLRKHIRAGYRSPYLLKLAEEVANGALDLESWRSSALPTEDLFRKVKAVKGIGDYAAGNILKLLGRYDYLGLDSWVRSKFYELHTKGRRVKDSTIEKHYAPFGLWRGLFFWLEMTRDWYTHKFPF